MPGKVKVKIIAGRNLPVMDRSSDTTDAYVEIKLGTTTYKTDVCRKSLHPQWNSEWYRFEVDDSELQDEPLQIRLMDHDTYSANDAIGKVYLDLNPLLLPAASLLRFTNDNTGNHERTPNSVMSGWIPVYDTMHGIRGEVNVTVKVELFTDSNKFRQSSCGVQFFCSPAIPQGYYAQMVHGFVEELVVNDDPEYQWIDKIRTPRASNEARQTLFFKLSGELQRKIGVKALDMGGNAVIAYKQSFDLEGDSGIVARGIGTAVTLVKIVDIPGQNCSDSYNEERANNYLKFLSSEKGFYLNKSHYNKYLPNLSKRVHTITSNVLDHGSKSVPSIDRPASRKFKRYNSNYELSPITPPIIHHASSLQTLLKQEDMRGTPGSGISQRLKNLRYSSQNILSKKMTALKAKLSDTAIPAIEIKPPSATNDSKRKKYKFRRTISDSNSMAELLVRSVIQAHSSLDYITETHDATTTVLQKQMSLNESSTEGNVKRHKGGSFSSLPDDSLSVHSPNGSDLSEASSSSEEEEEEESEQKDTRIDYDTVSAIVKNVRKLNMLQNSNHEVILTQTVDTLDEQEEIDSNEEASMKNTPEDKGEWQFDVSSIGSAEKKVFFTLGDGDDFSNNQITPIVEREENEEFETSTKENNEDQDKNLQTEFENLKITESAQENNDQRNIDADENLHWKFEDIPSDYNNRKILFSLGESFEDCEIPPKAEFEDFDVGSSDDEHCKEASDSNRSNSFENSIKTERKLIIPPVMMGANIESKGLVKTAMEMLLLDKVNLMGTYTPPSSPSIITNKTFRMPARSNSIETKTDESFYTKITETFETIRRSSTQSLNHHMKGGLGAKVSPSRKAPSGKDDDLHRSLLSLQDHNQQGRENVLGAPFTKLLISSPYSESLQSCSVANSPKENEYKHGYSSLDNVNVKMRFLSKAEIKLKNVLQTPLYLIRKDSRKKNNEKVVESKLQHGLLGTALENVLMDSVNEILVTSHVKDTKSSSNESQKSKQSTENNEDIKVGELMPKRDDNVLTAISEQQEGSNNDQESIFQVPNLKPECDLTLNITSQTPIPDLPANIEIEKGNAINKMHASLNPFNRTIGSPQLDCGRQDHGHQRTESIGTKISQSPAKLHSSSGIHRRSSDSDLSITPKGNSLTGSDRSAGTGMNFLRNNNVIRSTVPQENFDIMEYPFLTMSKFPTGFITYLGGAVSARSVKLLERISNIEEPESRDIWWSEIRMEIRSHARALNCNAVLGYSEATSICEDVCVLSASGTAAIIGYQYTNQTTDILGILPVIPRTYGVGKDTMSFSLDRGDFEKDKKLNDNNHRMLPDSPEKETTNSQPCSLCHLPYAGTSIAPKSIVSKCRFCKRGKVPEVLITTIEMPEGTPCIGRGCFLQSYISRPLKDLKGESIAKEISDGLPFLEYELHRILVNKLTVKGMNAIFGLKVRISIGERVLVGIATGTAVFLSPLPPPRLPKLISDRSTDEKRLIALQKELHETIRKNKEIYQIKICDNNDGNGKTSDTDESEDEQTILDLSVGNKDCCILEIDDPEDVEVINLLMEPTPPDGFHVVNTELVPGLDDLEIVKNLQMFTQVWRAKIHPPFNLDKHFHRVLQTIYFKLRRMIPCALCDMQFRVALPEPDEIQICVLGMALGLGDPPKSIKPKRKLGFYKRNDEELIFNMEEINQIPENIIASPGPTLLNAQAAKYRPKSPQRKKILSQRHIPYRERHGVDITPLCYVPGGKIERYLGNLNFFFIRETTSIREEGGLSGFIHSFANEVLAIVRAHVTALGGNAMVAYFLTECVLNHNPHKNQGQCLINVGGDVVCVSYFTEEQ